MPRDEGRPLTCSPPWDLGPQQAATVFCLQGKRGLIFAKYGIFEHNAAKKETRRTFFSKTKMGVEKRNAHRREKYERLKRAETYPYLLGGKPERQDRDAHEPHERQGALKQDADALEVLCAKGLRRERVKRGQEPDADAHAGHVCKQVRERSRSERETAIVNMAKVDIAHNCCGGDKRRREKKNHQERARTPALRRSWEGRRMLRPK